MFKNLKTKILSVLAFVVYRLWISTWRMKVYEPKELTEDLKNKTPLLFAFWHGEILGIVPFCKYYPVVSMASTSTDGQIIANVIEWLGIRAARGSSSKKGAQGLKQVLRFSRDGLIPVLPVDGPRGPVFVPKPGIFELSKILKAKIYPGRIICGKNLKFKSWDQSFLPLPFSKVLLYWGAPLNIVQDNEDPRSSELQLLLTSALNASGQSGLKEFANP